MKFATVLFALLALTPTAPADPKPALSWSTLGNASVMRFCPGDAELVAVDTAGELRRFRVADGVQLASTRIGTFPPGMNELSLDCRGDGAALALDAKRSPVIVMPDGKVVRPPTAMAAYSTAFAPDGSVLVATDDDGVKRWRGTDVTVAIPPREHQLDSMVGNNGVFVERYMPDDKPATTWITRIGDKVGKRVQMTGGISDVLRVAVAPDGAIAVGGTMFAKAWVDPARKPVTLLDASGTRVDGIAATKERFIAIDAGGSLISLVRPSMRKKVLERPCGEHDDFVAFAAATTGSRVAIACDNAGVRIFDLNTNKRVDPK